MTPKLLAVPQSGESRIKLLSLQRPLNGLLSIPIRTGKSDNTEGRSVSVDSRRGIENGLDSLGHARLERELSLDLRVEWRRRQECHQHFGRRPLLCNARGERKQSFDMACACNQRY
jgi:hypothetical protein